MAAGVGKTFRMLQEGRAELENGRDVVVGLLETHGRADTAALLDGLELLARRRVVYREKTFEEMDLPTIVRRGPEVCLVDELAHTNAPGVEHAKRYEDIEALLVAGIHVVSTVNIQHLDSLNDRIAELTGITVRETVPDRVLMAADEVGLVDISPEALLNRLRAGKVYPAARVEAALNNFFRIETLAALRGVAPRQVAEEVEAKRPCMAFGATVGVRSGPALGPAPRSTALQQAGSRAQRNAAARDHAGRDLADRGIRQHRCHRRPGRCRARHDVHPHGSLPSGARTEPLAHPATPTAHASAPRR